MIWNLSFWFWGSMWWVLVLVCYHHADLASLLAQTGWFSQFNELVVYCSLLIHCYSYNTNCAAFQESSVDPSLYPVRPSRLYRSFSSQSRLSFTLSWRGLNRSKKTAMQLGTQPGMDVFVSKLLLLDTSHMTKCF